MSESEVISWSEFSRLDSVSFQPRDFCETLDGGQSFRWDRLDGGEGISEGEIAYIGVFGKTVIRAKLSLDGSVWTSAPKGSQSSQKAFGEYLDWSTDYSAIRTRLRDTGDPVMLRALEIHPTLRILRQDPSEAIVGFICSSSKRIIQIKQCVRLLSEKLGTEIARGVFSTPNFETIAAAPLQTIIDCKLGFRAKYLKNSAEKIASSGFDPLALREMPYAEAKKYLLSLNGVGEKVADCILLFGASRFEAFPVDTWIKQAMTELYSTPEDSDKIRDFARAKFGEHSGFAQQLIFAAKRKNMI